VLGTAFLNSGNTLHPILAKSQCWCVDGESKFVLRIRPNAYYRVELPTATPEEKEQVEKLKTVLAKVLQYEVTPCPFKRGFTIELPEAPETPIQKKPWRPKTRLEATPEHTTEDFDYFARSRRKDSNLRNSPGVEVESPTTLVKSHGQELARSKTPQCDFSKNGSTKDEHDSEATDDTGLSYKELINNVHDSFDNFKTPTRPKGLRTGRAITAPPQLTIRTLSPSKNATKALPVPKLEKESSSVASSIDSFHSFHSPLSPFPPSPSFFGPPSPPPGSDDGIDVTRARGHKRDVSEITITDSTPELWEAASVNYAEDITYHSPPDLPATPTLTSDAASQDEDHWSEAVTPSPPTEVRRRTVRSKRRSQSPLPSSVNLYSPYSPRSHMSGHHFTNAILQRTCSLLLGPPVQLVALMLRIAAKIAKGAFKGSSIGFEDGGQRIPCSWDFSDGSDENDETWGEVDDYGFCLSRSTSAKDAKAREVGDSWEID